MLVSEMKQPHMGLLQKMFFYTGKLISRSTFWEKHVRLQAQIVHTLQCISTVHVGKSVALFFVVIINTPASVPSQL